MGTGASLYKAAEFLLEQLIEEEKASAEVIRLAKERGISKRTFDRAKARIGIKSRASIKSWVMYLPKERVQSAVETIEKMRRLSPLAESPPIKKIREYEISRDWVLVSREKDSGDEGKNSVAPSAGGVRVKVGGYEIEAGSGFPVEKLAELLQVFDGGESI